MHGELTPEQMRGFLADAEHELARVTEFTRQTFAVLSRALATGY
jgi:hypothetical protein